VVLFCASFLFFGFVAKANASITNNLQSYWKLDEASGMRYDSVGSNNLSAFGTGGVGQAVGKLGNAALFVSANSQYLSIGDNASLETGVGVSFTISAWVYLVNKSASVNMIAAKEDPTGVGEYGLYYSLGSDRFKFAVYSSGNPTVLANSLGSPSAGTWYFVVATHDGSAHTNTIRINDTYQDSIAAADAASDTAATFNIGYFPKFNYYSDSRIDSVGFWKRVLTPTEITELYNSGNGLEYPFNVTVASVASSTSATTATITWTTNTAASSTVNYGTDSSYGSTSTLAPLVTSHSITLTGLTPSTTYHFQVASADALGNVATSSDATFTTGVALTTFPTVTTSIATGVSTSTAIFNGSITATGGADATQSGFAYGTDSTLVSGVSTSTLGAKTGTTTFSQSLTGLTPNTIYYFRAYAVNSAGTSTGAILSATTTDITSPVVSLTAPSSGATVAGSSVSLSATATDDVGVVGVQFMLDGITNIGSLITSTSSPNTYSTTWNSTAITTYSSHTVYAVAHDAAGNYATSSINITVGNTAASITNNLQSYWKLDEASGTRFDSIGSNNLSEFGTGGVGQAVGKLGNAALFVSANSQYLSIGDNASLRSGSNVSFTISAWVYLTSKSAAVDMIMAKEDSTGVGEYGLYYSSGSDRFKFAVYSSGNPTVLANSLGSVSLNTWYFIVATHDGSAHTNTIRINDAYQDSIAAADAASDTAATFNIGYFPKFNYYSDSRIDSVGFWKRVLTPTEITELYNSGNGLEYPFNVTVASVASSTSATTATITWTTNTAASSTVNYGTDSSYGSTSTLAPLVTSHSITLTGLTPSTTYHFQVASADALGNVATSSDATFTTGVADTTPPNITSIASSTSAITATITWTTNEIANSKVSYGMSPGTYTQSTSSASLVTSHSIGLTGLSPSTLYYYVVVSADGSGNTSTSTEKTIVTKPKVTYLDILSTGQSLALAYYASPAISVTQPYNNLMLTGGVEGTSSPLIPLTESGLGAAGNVETISSGMANSLTSYDSQSRPVVVNLHGLSGTGYAGLMKGTAPYNKGIAQATTIKSQVTNVLDGNYLPIAVTAIHGEHDYNIGAGSAYEGDLVQWQSDYQNDLNVLNSSSTTIPLFISQMNAGWTGEVAVAQLSAHIDDPGKVILVEPKYQYHYRPADDLHMDINTEEKHAGEMFAKVINKVILNGQVWNPLMPSSLARTSNIITISYHIPVGTLAVDTSTVAARPNYGFEFTQTGGNSVSINSVELVNNNSQVKITLNAVPTGTNQHIRYAWTCYNGSGSWCAQAASSTAVGGNIRDTDSSVSPASDSTGLPLYDWGVTFDEPITLATLPTVATSAVTATSTMAATLNGSITSNGNASSTIRGFAWGTNSGLSGGDTATTTELGTFDIGSFTKALTGLTPNIAYYFRAYAVNSAGTSTGSISSFSTTDITPPTVSMTAPTGGSVVSGSSVSLSATVTDDVGVIGVQFMLDGITNIGSLITSTSSPNTYTTTWDSTSASNAPHTLQAVAHDATGNYATSSINITVDNTIHTYSIGGSVSGLTGILVLQNNSGDDLTLASNDSFTFNTSIASGNPYSVSVLTQPTGQTCSVSNGSGNVSGNVTSVSVTCTTNSVTTTPIVTPAASYSSSGGSVSASALAQILAPGPATTAYLASLNHTTFPGCPAGFTCQPNPAPVTAPTAATQGATFSENLTLGNVNPEVKALQIYLNAHGYTLASTGPGSPGNETDKFGLLTKTALVRFQKAHGIPATGFFGPMTRGYIISH
jgi:phosphodiesterase/alkaline phosphatase D-like protein